MINKIAVLALGLGFMFYRLHIYCIVREEKTELHSWLKEHDLLDYEAKLHKFGTFDLFIVVSFLFGNNCTVAVIYRVYNGAVLLCHGIH